jgi:hypothetical protein
MMSLKVAFLSTIDRAREVRKLEQVSAGMA